MAELYCSPNFVEEKRTPLLELSSSKSCPNMLPLRSPSQNTQDPVHRIRKRARSRGKRDMTHIVSPKAALDTHWGATDFRRCASQTIDLGANLELILQEEKPQGSPNIWPDEEPSSKGRVGVGGMCISMMDRVPGICIGMTMNIMLCVPFGLSFFPATWEPFPVPRSIGLQMWLFSTFVGQVVMAFDSDFPCAMGMMMVENIPFMHSIANSITASQGHGVDALATCLVAFALSTFFIGIAFMALGRYRLGRAVNYFPRNLIIGCIGGIGIFVTSTGLEVSTGVSWNWSWDTFVTYGSQEVAPLWMVSALFVLILNILLKLIKWPLFAPFYFLGTIPIFYLAISVLGLPLAQARDGNWLFQHPPETDCWLLWRLFDISAIRWDLIFAETPTLVALTCFGLMHAPINIPSLSVSTDFEVDMDHELTVHGWTNIISGLLGGVPNYLCYSNSLLYYKCKGGGRASGCVLSVGVAACFMAGPDAIAYVPRCMAGCLLIHVGLDLTKEALIDSFGAFDTFEYVSVLLITVTMTAFSMTTGIGLGLVLSAVTFTLQHMRYSEPVRGAMPATTLRSSSDWSRNDAQREVLERGLARVLVVQLQGTLFFGNATALWAYCDDQLADAEGMIRTLILDFTIVRSLESSAAETIAKIYPIARKHGAALVYVRGSTDGFPTTAPLSMRLSQLSSQVSQKGANLHIADDLDGALVWVEEEILEHARRTGKLMMDPEPKPDESESLPLRQLRSLCQGDAEMASRLLMYMERVEVTAGTVLWRQGTTSDHCLLLVEGVLQSSLEEEAGTAEECHPGCVLGEYAFLMGTKRMGTLCALSDSVVYTLDAKQWDVILDRDPKLAYVLARITISYMGSRCHHVANRIWDTRCLPV